MLTLKMTLLKFHLYFSNNISTRPTKYRESEKFELVAREIQGLSTVVSTLVLPTCIKDEVVVNEFKLHYGSFHFVKFAYLVYTAGHTKYTVISYTSSKTRRTIAYFQNDVSKYSSH